jgi:hypothetical protein
MLYIFWNVKLCCVDNPDYRDVFCKNCDAKLGWMYEFATEDNQRYDTGVFFSGIFRIVNTNSDMIEAFSDSGLGLGFLVLGLRFQEKPAERYLIFLCTS